MKIGVWSKLMLSTAILAVGFGVYAWRADPVRAQETEAEQRQPSEEGSRVYIISPQDGTTVSSPVLVQFALSGMGVAPAGVEWEMTGHHHLIIDAELPPLDQAIPSDDNHIHFGGGQTEVLLDLAPGTHTLQLLLADAYHVPHDPAVYSEPITITVE